MPIFLEVWDPYLTKNVKLMYPSSEIKDAVEADRQERFANYATYWEYYEGTQYDKENDEKLHQFVLNRAPLIEIIDAHSFVVTDSPFYRALNDGQKALFYVSNNPNIKYPYYDIKIPDKYKTREFLEYENVYYVNNRFSLTQKSIKMMLKIGHLISQLCNYTNDISLEDVIEQLHDPIPID